MNTDYAAQAQAIKTFFETITLPNLAQLPELYAPTARFKDPFNDVTGLAEVQRIFAHMFVQVQNPCFVVNRIIQDGTDVMMLWRFDYDKKGFGHGRIIGSTHFELDAAGKITLHRDYWDAAEELYEKVPFLGSFMRFLKRRVNAG